MSTARSLTATRACISGEERKARYLLFIGKRKAASKCGLTEKQIERLEKEMTAAGVGPDSQGPYSVGHASIVLGLQRSGRQVRGYCEQGRLCGCKIGMMWTISREELVEFGGKDRRAGAPLAAAKSA